MRNEAIAPELAAFYRHLLSQAGWPYVWPTEANRYSGKGLKGCLYPEGRDCSGTVTWALWQAGHEDLRSDWNTRRMFASWQPVDEREAQPGDFVFYANRRDVIEHVMTLTEDGRAFGATGAGSNCTTPELARQLGASVRYERIHYRPVAGFRRNPLRKSP